MMKTSKVGDSSSGKNICKSMEMEEMEMPSKMAALGFGYGKVAFGSGWWSVGKMKKSVPFAIFLL
jgi:hypothetical protein